MRSFNTVFICAFLTIFLSIPLLLELPRMLPFLDQRVRAAAPAAVRELRKQGIWVVNVDLERIEKTNGGVCFHWTHQYRSRLTFETPEIITTCL